jgi:nitrite reductase/ring-hydroxylating ferredoxin subunit/uncharacterized membrane protein
MRSAVHFSGHPVHPMLVGFPIAYLLGSAVIDLWAGATNRPSWFRTARHLNTLGLGAAVAAAVPGAIDYVLTVPPRSSAQKRATDHMLANVSALALFAASRAGRRTDDERPSWWRVATELCASGLLTAGSWMGGTLVYRNQIAVDHRYADAGKWRSDIIAAESGDSGLIDVGPDDELRVDQMKLLHSAGRRIVLARSERGYAAFDDRCTHKGGPLSDGSLACGIVQCPWHGSQFAIDTGAVKHGPAQSPVRTYDVTQNNGRLWLRLPRE